MLTNLTRKRRLDDHGAENLLQKFIATTFLEKNLAAVADPQRGRFRTLVLTALDRFVVSEQRRTLGQPARIGQSVRAWCRKHRVTETAFYWWRKEVVRRDAEQKPSARRDAEDSAASFVPVHVSEEPGRERAHAEALSLESAPN